MASTRYAFRVLPSFCLAATLAFGMGLMVGCGSTEPVEQPQNASDTGGATQDTADGPTLKEKRERYSTYYEYYQDEDYEGARSNLLWILERAPEFPEGDDRNYRRVVKLYEGLADSSAEASMRTAYLDTATTYLSNAPEQMGQLGIPFERYKWEIRKGRFVDLHQDALSATTALESPISYYQTAFRLAPEKVHSYYIRRVLESYLEADSLEGALDVADAATKTRSDDPKVATLAELVRKRVFARNPQARVAHLKAQVEQHPDSTDLLTELYTAYRENDNASEASRLADRLMKQKPSVETVRKIAEMHRENGAYEAALAVYDQAVQEGTELKYQDYFNRGTVYQRVGQPASARREYQKALDANESFGQAYIAIGDLYSRAVNQCSGDKMSREDRAVYWAAVDKYQQAKTVDPSVLEVASRRIETYTEVFPTQEDIFYQSRWQAGASVPIDYGCYSWIRETTTVRAAPSSD